VIFGSPAPVFLSLYFATSSTPSTLTHPTSQPEMKQVLHVARELPVSITLKNILAKAFPEEYTQRLAEEAAATATPAAAGLARAGSGGGGGSSATLPLFVMSTVLPGEKMALNIFEPRCVCGGL